MLDDYEAFLAFYPDYHDLSKSRRRAMTRRVRSLQAFAGPLPDVTAADFENYVLSMRHAEGLAPSTIAFEMGLLRPLFKWAALRGILPADEYLRMGEVKAPRGASAYKPKPYAETQIRTALRKLDRTFPYASERTLTRYAKGTAPYRSIWRHAGRLQRDVVFHLALVCGLRVNEIVLLDIDDFHPDNANVIVRNAKGDVNGSKLREVPMTADVRSKIRAWLDMRELLLRVEQVPDHGRPWVTTFPGRRNRIDGQTAYPGREILHTDGIRTMLADLDVTPHRLRHSCATLWLRAGMPIEKVQKLMGHSEVSMTQRYVELLTEDLAVAIDGAQRAFDALVSGLAPAAEQPVEETAREREWRERYLEGVQAA